MIIGVGGLGVNLIKAAKLASAYPIVSIDIHDNKKEGSPLRDLMQVLPSFSKHQVQSLLRELKGEEKIRVEGKTNAGRWYPFSPNKDIASNSDSLK